MSRVALKLTKARDLIYYSLLRREAKRESELVSLKEEGREFHR